MLGLELGLRREHVVVVAGLDGHAQDRRELQFLSVLSGLTATGLAVVIVVIEDSAKDKIGTAGKRCLWIGSILGLIGLIYLVEPIAHVSP